MSYRFPCEKTWCVRQGVLVEFLWIKVICSQYLVGCSLSLRSEEGGWERGQVRWLLWFHLPISFPLPPVQCMGGGWIRCQSDEHMNWNRMTHHFVAQLIMYHSADFSWWNKSSIYLISNIDLQFFIIFYNFIVILTKKNQVLDEFVDRKQIKFYMYIYYSKIKNISYSHGTWICKDMNQGFIFSYIFSF